MVSSALNAGTHVVLLEPTPHARPVTDGPPEMTLQDVHTLTRRYAAAMMRVSQETNVGFVPLFEKFLEIENRLAGTASLYADEVHLNGRGDLLYSQIVYEYLDL